MKHHAAPEELEGTLVIGEDGNPIEAGAQEPPDAENSPADNDQESAEPVEGDLESLAAASSIPVVPPKVRAAKEPKVESPAAAKTLNLFGEDEE